MIFAQLIERIKKFELKAICPKTRWGQFAFMFSTELVSFFIICSNMRAVAQANYIWSAITDTLFLHNNLPSVK
jgi:hypothetical protein